MKQSAEVKKSRSKSARLLYRPVGIVGGIVAGLVAGKVVDQVWKRTPGEGDEVPSPLQSRYPWAEVVAAAALQGAVFASVRAGVDRFGAWAFERWTGEWPGE
ncbi:MAG: DUF4235 domain-containing protein [Marmoricola sp.]